MRRTIYLIFTIIISIIGIIWIILNEPEIEDLYTICEKNKAQEYKGVVVEYSEKNWDYILSDGSTFKKYCENRDKRYCNGIYIKCT